MVMFNQLTNTQQRRVVAAAEVALDHFGDLRRLDPAIVEKMVAIAGAESNRWDPRAAGDSPSALTNAGSRQELIDACIQENCNGFCSFGLWQVFLHTAFAEICRAGGAPGLNCTLVQQVNPDSALIGDPRLYSNACATAEWLFNPNNNARVSRELIETQMRAGRSLDSALTNVWSTWRFGQANDFMPAAQEAVRRAERGFFLPGVGSVSPLAVGLTLAAVGAGAWFFFLRGR